MSVNAYRATLGLALFLLGASASTAALAWHHGGHARIGVYIGAPGFWHFPHYYPRYYAPYYPPYAYAPVIVAPPAPQVYIERGGTAAAAGPAQPTAQSQSASPSNFWYYCADSKAYYPYVKECQSTWQPVAPQPQAQ